ncbi:helix-turn-helix domain-containing protein [Paenibacillus zeirhizosphaerae]|uniref:helix-turn-helix domain-containing protein n=1 Tax=Paenibacillus zeirhizosphaerae TaxID=2987519 RepID=UPI003521E9EA
MEIVQFTIVNDLDYQKAIDKYGVSYPQVYAWVRKYTARGQEALQDHRGRKKPLEELDEQERLKLRIKGLEARNEYLEMENALAKKVGRDPAKKYTLTLARHVDIYQAIQELHAEKGYAITKLVSSQESPDLPTTSG